jgi:hypothetical protein
LAQDPDAANARVGEGDFTTKNSDGGHIYVYTIGPTMTPHALAAKMGNREVAAVLAEHGGPARRLIAAAWAEEVDQVAKIKSDHPDLKDQMGPDARAIADAAQQGKTETVKLLLSAGLDPTVPGMDSGSALHVACWFGYIDVVNLLIGRVPVDLRDAHHGSPPLGWATHGAHHCRNDKGDYVAVVEALLKAGADPNALANSAGDSMPTQSGAREDIKEVLRKYGAK